MNTKQKTRLTGVWTAAICVLFMGGVVYGQKAITVPVGQQQVVDVKKLARVSVGDDKVANVQVVASGEQIIITGIKVGTTDLITWNSKGKKITRAIYVISRDPRQFAAEVRELLTDVEGIKVKVVGGKVLLDGAVLTASDKLRVEKVAKAYPEVINLVKICTGIHNEILAEEIKKNIGIPNVNVKIIGNRVLLRGFVVGEEESKEVEKIAGAFAENVINLLKVKKVMIEVDVKFAEINATAGKDMGMNLLGGTLAGGAGMASGGGATPSWNIGYNLTKALNFTHSKGNATIRKSLHQSTLSGGEAVFEHGGEIGYKVAGSGSADVIWKKYGMLLKVKPEVDSFGEVTMHINLEVSQIDPTVEDRTGLKIYRSESDVVIKPGQSVILSGVTDVLSSDFKKYTPGIGKIPVLGLLFSKKQAAKEKKQIIVLVTPTTPTFIPAKRTGKAMHLLQGE
ncbi:pilus assembly protein N-terminal domain-containing protein [bacterium]|nr:pilus assembly protein N-terminal domain-containing protein [bacterium]